MKKILKQQTELQGTKEFGNIKGVEALSAKELKEVGGGFWQFVGAALLAGAIYDFTTGFVEGVYKGIDSSRGKTY